MKKTNEEIEGEKLEKRSKNVREQTRNLSSAQAHQRIVNYIRRRAMEARFSYNQNPQIHAPPGVTPTFEYNKGFPASHELGHMLMTPTGESVMDHQKKLGEPQKSTIYDSDWNAHQEHAANAIQSGIERRAGVQPLEGERIEGLADKRYALDENRANYDAGRKLGVPELNAFDEGRKVYDQKTGTMQPGTSVHAKINARAMRKNMDDKNSKLAPPQWLGRPILDPTHHQDLETRAAMNEFHHKMPRHEAEQRAHDDYVKEQRERAAAHHLAGMKASMATGNHEDARRHWALYDLHLKALGKESVGAIPPEIEKRMMEDGDKPVYKFKAHKGDLYALHEPSKDTAPPAGQPIQKAESYKGTYSTAAAEGLDPSSGKHVAICDKHGAIVNTSSEKKARSSAADTRLFCDECRDGEMKKGEAKQCKWKLGERRCQRMVSGDYCYSHVDHWANKIKTKEQAQGVAKSLLKGIAKIAKGMMPPAGTGHLAAPAAPAAPAMHSDPVQFLGALKKLPQGSPERGKLITSHMNHGPFLSALQQHPQGKQIHAMLTQHLNSKANAGVKPGATVVTAKTELAKGDVVKFPGNKAPAVDQGKPAAVHHIAAAPAAPSCPDCTARAKNALASNVNLDTMIGPQSAAIYREKFKGTTGEQTNDERHRVLSTLLHARHSFQKK